MRRKILRNIARIRMKQEGLDTNGFFMHWREYAKKGVLPPSPGRYPRGQAKR